MSPSELKSIPLQDIKARLDTAVRRAMSTVPNGNVLLMHPKLLERLREGDPNDWSSGSVMTQTRFPFFGATFTGFLGCPKLIVTGISHYALFPWILECDISKGNPRGIGEITLEHVSAVKIDKLFGL